MLQHINIKPNLLKDVKYKHLYIVERLNELVLQGTAIRNAYKEVGCQIETETFTAPPTLNHTHEGSIGNLSNHLVKEELKKFEELFK
jgi:argininosuccinate lyase